MLKRILLITALSTFYVKNALAQTTFPSNGAPHPIHTTHVFTNAVIHIDYETTINSGILIIQDGKVCLLYTSTNADLF